MQEEWRKIDRYPYWVSDFGEVRRHETARVLKAKKHPGGYLFVCLSRGPDRKQRTIHALVAEAFIGPRPAGLVINHKNGIKTDNRPENLEYVSPLENDRHARMVLGRSNAGINHGLAKFTWAQVKEIRRRRALGYKLLEIASIFNCSFQHVSDIALGKRRRAA